MEIYKSLWLKENEKKRKNRRPETYDLVLKLRDVVEEADLHGNLPTPKWLMLCAAMDVIEDTQQAIEAYIAAPANRNRRVGERYLRTYGVLQALFVQQDSARDLCNALSVPHLWNPSPVERVRELRIKSIGHPTVTRKSQRSRQSSHFIVQISLGNRGFELHSFDGDGNMTRQSVSIPKLAAEQVKHINETLKALLKHIT